MITLPPELIGILKKMITLPTELFGIFMIGNIFGKLYYVTFIINDGTLLIFCFVWFSNGYKVSTDAVLWQRNPETNLQTIINKSI